MSVRILFKSQIWRFFSIFSLFVRLSWTGLVNRFNIPIFRLFNPIWSLLFSSFLFGLILLFITRKSFDIYKNKVHLYFLSILNLIFSQSYPIVIFAFGSTNNIRYFFGIKFFLPLISSFIFYQWAKMINKNPIQSELYPLKWLFEKTISCYQLSMINKNSQSYERI